MQPLQGKLPVYRTWVHHSWGFLSYVKSFRTKSTCNEITFAMYASRNVLFDVKQNKDTQKYFNIYSAFETKNLDIFFCLPWKPETSSLFPFGNLSHPCFRKETQFGGIIIIFEVCLFTLRYTNLKEPNYRILLLNSRFRGKNFNLVCNVVGVNYIQFPS